MFTGSVQSFVGSKLKEPYNFAKHGVAGLAKSIAREGAEYGIYTYTICPSFIKTPLVEKQIPEQARDLGFHFIFLEHDLEDCRTISRRDMRNTVNKYMTVVLNEAPLDPTLVDFDDSLAW